MVDAVGEEYHPVDCIFNERSDDSDQFIQLRYDEEVWQNWETVCKARSQAHYAFGEPRFDAFWLTVVAGCAPDQLGKAKHAYMQWDKLVVSFRKSRTAGLEATGPISRAIGWGVTLVHAFKVAFRSNSEDFDFPTSLKITHYRRIVRTGRGYFSLAPGETKVDDYVALLKGADMPLIIRSAGVDRWKIMGAAYVHGFMDGEMFDDAKCSRMWFV